MDWRKWHTKYDESPILQARLGLARAQISEAIRTCPDPHIRLVSLCAGDGRDVIGTLAAHPRREQTLAYLVEIDSALVAQGESAVVEFGLSAQVRFVHADATLSTTYASIAPADVLVVCGVFGNVRPSGTAQMIENLRRLCRCQGRVIWTRTLAEPNDRLAAEAIRHHFSTAGFHEVTLQHTTPPGVVVATHVYSDDPDPLIPAVKLFEFADHDQIGSSQP